MANDELVERVARAQAVNLSMRLRGNPNEWQAYLNEGLRSDTRAALSTAEPLIRAQAFEEAAKVAEGYADPSLADNRDVTIAATSARAGIDIAAAIRNLTTEAKDG